MARSNDAAAQMLQEFAELLAISATAPPRSAALARATTSWRCRSSTGSTTSQPPPRSG